MKRMSMKKKTTKGISSVYKYGRTIPDFVKQLRFELDMSQREFGELLGVHAQYVSNVERGVYNNPIAFCGLLYTVVSSDRAIYLTDLVSEASTMRALDRMKGLKRGKTVAKKRKSG